MRNLIKAMLERFGLTRGANPLVLPTPVSDNQYLAASANAGVVDNSTGAYDKYLFSEDEIPEMPYEAAVDSHLNLMSNRLEERFMRFVSRAKRQVIRAQSGVRRQALGVQLLEASMLELQGQLDNELQILRGEKTGKHGLFWAGEAPVLITPLAASIKLVSRYVIFLLVGSVDIFIIWSSFVSINIRAIEAAFLTAPAVAAQLVFPHIAGTRLRLIVNGMQRKVSVWVEVVVALSIWFTFIYVIAMVRVIFIRSLIESDGGQWDGNLQTIFVLLSVVLIGALGGWLAFMSIRENPHLDEVLRLKMKIRKLEFAISRRKSKLERFNRKLALADEAQTLLNNELELAVQSSRLELAEAAKSVYRRALINEMADPEFTKSYFQAEAGEEKSV